MTDRPSAYLSSRRYTPEQVDDIVWSCMRGETAISIAERIGTTPPGIFNMWGRARRAGVLADKLTVRPPRDDADPSRPQPSMPRVAWLERPMPRVNI